MPTDPKIPLLERPKCYADPCGRQLNGNCVRHDCPVMAAAVPDAPPPGGLPIVETPLPPLEWRPLDVGAVPPGVLVAAEKAGAGFVTPVVMPGTPEYDAVTAMVGRKFDDAAALARLKVRVKEVCTPPDPPFPVDPRDEQNRSVLQQWVRDLGRRHQGVIVAGVRGCDSAPKHDPSKLLARVYRAYTLVPFVKRAERAATFIKPATGAALLCIFTDFRKSLDHYPHHYVMHVVHAVEIVGYHHFDATARAAWSGLYFDLCRGLHVNPETPEQLDARLNADEEAFGREDAR